MDYVFENQTICYNRNNKDKDKNEDNKKVKVSQEYALGDGIYKKIINNDYNIDNIHELYAEIKFLCWLDGEDKYKLSYIEFENVISSLLKSVIIDMTLLEHLFQNKYYNILDILTEYRVIKSIYLQKIINIIIKNEITKHVGIQWISNLIKNDYPFSNKEIEVIFESEFDITKKQQNKLLDMLKDSDSETESIDDAIVLKRVDGCGIPDDDVDPDADLYKRFEQLHNELNGDDVATLGYNKNSINKSVTEKVTVVEDEHEDITINDRDVFDMSDFKLLVSHNNLDIIINYLQGCGSIMNAKILEELPSHMRTKNIFERIFKMEPPVESNIEIIDFIHTKTTVLLADITGLNEFMNKLLIDIKFSREFIDKLDFVFQVPKSLKNILFLISKFADFKICFPMENIKRLLLQVNYTKYGNTEEYRFDSTLSLYNIDPADEYLQTLTVFLSLQPELYCTEFLEYAIRAKDDLTFDLIIDKIYNTPIECTYLACEMAAKHMLERLLKENPNHAVSECIDHLDISKPRYDNTNICEVLVKAGVTLTTETLEKMFNKGTSSWTIFESIKMDYDIELYKLCHKYNEFPYQLICKIKMNPFNEMELREKIKGYNANNEDDIIRYIESNEIKPDYMMYDDSVKHNKTKLIEYFEKNHGFKPNMDTLLRIDDFTRRMNYYQRLLKLQNDIC